MEELVPKSRLDELVANKNRIVTDFVSANIADFRKQRAKSLKEEIKRVKQQFKEETEQIEQDIHSEYANFVERAQAAASLINAAYQNPAAITSVFDRAESLDDIIGHCPEPDKEILDHLSLEVLPAIYISDKQYDVTVKKSKYETVVNGAGKQHLRGFRKEKFILEGLDHMLLLIRDCWPENKHRYQILTDDAAKAKILQVYQQIDELTQTLSKQVNANAKTILKSIPEKIFYLQPLDTSVKILQILQKWHEAGNQITKATAAGAHYIASIMSDKPRKQKLSDFECAHDVYASKIGCVYKEICDVLGHQRKGKPGSYNFTIEEPFRV